ncbi:protein FAM161A-like isoform X2 [Trematomus bernacchii]|uniref:protein FAM161A-like isoform X2 n=1 Tax=Trematomus bernacchii TaxID=40690 RepID=UPI00146E42AD|nr:protein FAM161A-like isoform X2 [Trematomus bernacchii]
MAAMFRSSSLENTKEMSLFEREKDNYFVTDEDCRSEEFDQDSVCSEEGRGGRSVRRSLFVEIYGLQREPHIHFSNQEYYKRLEELKSAHLKNMAELERMYIGQHRESPAEEEEDGGRTNREDRLSISGPVRKLQRINSQEELDFHDSSSGSDQSELYGASSTGDLELENPRTAGQGRTFERDFLLSPEEMTTQKQFRFKPSCLKPKGRISRPTGVRVRSNFNVTVPKPFQMMLREEERKRHKVRTRSEIQLENTLLKRELEELQECQKKFRASPAPAHIHQPFYEVISRRLSQRSTRSKGSRKITNRNQIIADASPQPFHFLERERMKREAKIVAELGNLGLKEERQAFKARPMPSSVYGSKHKANIKTTSHQFTDICTHLHTEGQRDPNSDASPDSCKPQTWPSSKPVKKQIEVSIEMVKGEGVVSD